VSQQTATDLDTDRKLQALALNEEGEKAFREGMLAAAERCFDQAYELDSRNVNVCNNLAVLHWHLGNVEDAVRYLADAIEIDAADRDLVINGGQILAELGRVDEAQALYQAFLEKNPQDETVGALVAALGRTGEALKDKPENELNPQGGRGGNAGGLHVAFTDYTTAGHSQSAPRISVVIPSYNQARFLEQTICSVLDQNYPNLELIVMDGGSTDQSVEIIKKYQDRIAYWTSGKDKGQYWAVDAGLRRSTGEIMTWINSDDMLHPNSFSTVASIFSQLNDVDWVTGTPNIMDETGQQRWVCTPIPVYSREYYLQKRYDYPNYIQQEGTFWRRSLWEKAGGSLKTSLSMAGDLELWMRFFRHARLHTANVLLGCFRQYGDQKTGHSMGLYKEEACVELDREITRFRERREVLPSPAPIIEVHNAGAPAYLVTAIVSTYNSEQFIRGCLEDLESQTIADRLEIIVVDSGSEQDEAAIVREFQQRYNNIRYIRTERRETIYSAWNRAVSQARGKYLTNANTDDRHRRDALQRLAAQLEANPNTALVYADSAVTRAPNASFGQATVVGHFRWPEFCPRQLFRVCYVGPHPMWRKSLHQSYGYFDASLKVAGDYDFWLRIAPHETFRHVPETLGLYLESPGSLEHAFAAVGAGESELVRARNWPAVWGERPKAGGAYLTLLPQTDRGSAETATPLVSVIMPTKDRPEFLARAIDSVLTQTYANWELIIVNDGGESVLGLVEGRNASQRIRCIEFDTSNGQAAARNVALREARGHIICYLDDDDRYLPNHLHTVVTELSDGGDHFVYTDAVVIEEQWRGGAGEELNRSHPYVHASYSRETLLVNNYIPINTWAHTRVCLEECGVFDESLLCYEDWEFLLRLSARFLFRHVTSTTVEVRRRAGIADNVSRRRLVDTVDAYKEIYRRHSQNLTNVLEQRRRDTLQKLEKAIASHVSISGSQQDAATMPVEEYGKGRDPEGPPAGLSEHRYRQWVEKHKWSELEIEHAIERMSGAWKERPAVHFILTYVPGQADALADTLDSVTAQVYSGWGLSVVSNVPCPNALFDELAMVEWCQVSGNLMDGVNRVALESDADWIGLLSAGDRIHPAMLYKCIDQLLNHPHWQLIYMDEDKVARSGERHAPLFKPEFDLELLRALPYTGDIVLANRETLLALGGYTAESGVAAYELAFRVAEAYGENAIGHIADVLIHRSVRVVEPADEQVVAENRRRCVVEHLQRCQIQATVRTGVVPDSHFVDYACSHKPVVDVIVPVQGVPQLLDAFLDGLLAKTDYTEMRLIIVVDQGFEANCDLMEDQRVTVEHYPPSEGPWSRVQDVVERSEAEYLLFISPNAIAIQPSWLERLVAHIQRDDVAIVAPRLVSPEQRVVDGSIILGAGPDSVGAIAHSGLPLNEPGYMQRAQVAQAVSAVSLSCMLVRKSAWLAAGAGESEFSVPFYRAIELCLRVQAAGKKTLWTPHSTLLLAVDQERERTDAPIDGRVKAESEKLRAEWMKQLANDRAYNPNLALGDDTGSIDTDFAAAWEPGEESKVRVMGFGVGSYGSWQYRVVQPLCAVHNGGLARGILLPKGGKRPARLPSLAELERRGVTSMLLHNTIHEYCIDALTSYRKHNKLFVVFGQDDLMFALPPKNPFSKTVYRDMKSRVRKCLSLVDRLVVTTEPLAEAMRGMAEDIRVVPNYLDERIWGGLQSRRGVSDRPRVGWAGAPQHRGDLELLEEVVRATAKEVDWVFMGMCPDSLRPCVREVHEVVSFAEYPQKLATLNLDIAVAPLEHNRFNEAKSNLRVLEYGMLGWPVIASAIEPYRGAPVCTVPNQSRAWIRAIRERIADLESAWVEGDELRDWVRENWILQQHLGDWLDALDPAESAGQHRRKCHRVSGL